MHNPDFWRIKYQLPLTASITTVDINGKPIKGKTCLHSKIPGLDSDYCQECRKYFTRIPPAIEQTKPRKKTA